MNNNELDNLKEYKTTRRVAGILALILFGVVLVCVLPEHTTGFDDPIREFFYGLRNPALTDFAIVITNFANKIFIICLCLIFLIVPQTRMTFGIPLSAGSLGTILINTLLKHVIQRDRPEVLHLVEESGYSFASGHSVSSMFFYGLTIWLVCRYVNDRIVRRTLVIVVSIPMIRVGFSRIYLGVHYPTDVLGGWCVGFAAIILTIEIINAIEKRSS